MDKWTMIYKTLHRKLKTEQQEPHWKPRVNSGAPEGYAVMAPLVATEIMIYEWLYYFRSSL
jgi:hypothetical protein